jgi:hypothetical protein
MVHLLLVVLDTRVHSFVIGLELFTANFFEPGVVILLLGPGLHLLLYAVEDQLELLLDIVKSRLNIF